MLPQNNSSASNTQSSLPSLSPQLNQNSAPPITPTPPTYLPNEENQRKPKSTFILIIGLIILVILFLSVGGYYGYKYFYFPSNRVNTSTTAQVDLQTTTNNQFDIDTINDSIFMNAEKSIPNMIDIAGTLKRGETLNTDIDIDESSETYIFLTSNGVVDNFTLVSPSGVVISQESVSDKPNIATYSESEGTAETPPMLMFTLKNPEIGKWKAKLINNGDTFNYKISSIIKDSFSIQTSGNKSIYTPNERITIAAHFIDYKNLNDLTNVKINSIIQKPDGSEETISLNKNANNIFIGQYTVPNISGYISIVTNASGLNSGNPFTRSNTILLMVNSQDAKLTGLSSEKVVDSNSNNLYDTLDFTFEVEASKAVECAISVELYKDSKNITQRGDFFKLIPGKQPITLSFDGKAINESKFDGPYQIKRIFITPITTGITSDSNEGVILTTKPYKFTEFEAENK